MATVAYTEYLPNIRLQAVGCPENILIDAVRDAVIRFCEDSLIWRITNAAANISTLTDTYSVLPASPTEIRVVVPTYVEYDGKEVWPRTEEELDIVDCGWRNTDPGVPINYLVETVDTIRFSRVPIEDVTNGLITRVAVKPTQASTEADELIYEDWRPAIESGAVSMLSGQKDKAWSDPDKAVSEGKAFNFYIQRAKARAVMGHTRKSTSARMRQWV